MFEVEGFVSDWLIRDVSGFAHDVLPRETLEPIDLGEWERRFLKTPRPPHLIT